MSVTRVQLVGNVSTGASFAGIVTATSFIGNVTGTASTASFATTSFGLSGTPNITVGTVTGNLTGNATGLSGTPNITVGTIAATSLNASGIITATSFSGNGANLTGVGLGTTGSINTSGIITASSFSGNGSGLTGVAATTLTIGAGTTALPSISPTGDSNTGIFFPSADTIAFSEGGVEALRVDSSGRLLVGISTSGNANGGILQLSSGITFPATAVAASDANTLDDYEEGTWTASVNGASAYSSQTGYYIKVGNLIFISLAISFTSSNPGGGGFITGAPFTPQNGSQGAIAFGRNTYTTGYEPTGFIQYSGGAIYVITLSTGNSATPRTGGAEIILSGCYTIA